MSFQKQIIQGLLFHF